MQKLTPILLFIFLWLFFAVIRGSYWKIWHVYSEDETQVVTILTKKDERYIADGKVTEFPTRDFVYLSLDVLNKEIRTANEEDGIMICFQGTGEGWRIINPWAILLESRLSKKFEFDNELPIDSLGIRSWEKEIEQGGSIYYGSHDIMVENKNGVQVKVEKKYRLFLW